MEWATVANRIEPISVADVQAARAAVESTAETEAATSEATDDSGTVADSETPGESEGMVDSETTADSEATAAGTTQQPEPSPTRVVADADVLAADLLVGGDARRALEAVWQHPWMTLVASDPLLATATRVVESLTTDVAADWEALLSAWREPVSHPPGDHPALGSAYRGGAMQLLAFEGTLTTPKTAATLSQRFPVSIREPAAFCQLFDPESLYQTVSTEPYPGPARKPRFE